MRILLWVIIGIVWVCEHRHEYFEHDDDEEDGRNIKCDKAIELPADKPTFWWYLLVGDAHLCVGLFFCR